MEEKNKFLKRETKIMSVASSVFMGLALVVLVIFGLVVGKFVEFSTVGSSVVLGIMSVLLSIVQIKVFNDYKSKNKYLCADGIFNLCLTILIAIVGTIYASINVQGIDLRYIIFALAAIFAVWKLIVAFLAFRKKYFNAFVEIILAVLWLLSGVAVLLSALEVDSAALILCVSNYALGVAIVFYILYSYIFNVPSFLETPEAIAELRKEEEERQIRLNRFNRNFERVEQKAEPIVQESKEIDIEAKLEKLKSLKEKGFITDEEFEKKRKEIIENGL